MRVRRVAGRACAVPCGGDGASVSAGVPRYRLEGDDAVIDPADTRRAAAPARPAAVDAPHEVADHEVAGHELAGMRGTT